MKTFIKRALAFAFTLALAATVQWVSGVPFTRSPGEEQFLLIALSTSVLMAAYPGLSE
jgi:hypothetical protein